MVFSSGRLIIYIFFIKVDVNIHNHNYFLFLIHPVIIVNHFQVLDDFLAYCGKKYSKSSFTTCISFVQELNEFDEKKKKEIQ